MHFWTYKHIGKISLTKPIMLLLLLPYLSRPAAAPVLAGAAPLAPKPNPPAPMYPETQEPYKGLETSENIKIKGKYIHRIEASLLTCSSARKY
jgi:hypothetical protein